MIFIFEQRKTPKEPLPPTIVFIKNICKSKSHQDENNPNSKYLGVKPIQNATLELPNFEQQNNTTQLLHTQMLMTYPTVYPKEQ